MILLKTVVKKFGKMGEKTGWTYIKISKAISEKIKPRFKKSYRVKGKINSFEISKLALIPMGDGNFILPLNADLRKKAAIRQGNEVTIQLVEDTAEIELDTDFMECIQQEKRVLEFFEDFSPSHKKYFSSWIASAKTIETKTKRIAKAISALERKMSYSLMMREGKN